MYKEFNSGSEKGSGKEVHVKEWSHKFYMKGDESWTEQVVWRKVGEEEREMERKII